ncbi:hypothetical protein B0H13DRAFT_1854854 [Mycena leptocephala]|nr:hypothetical protein B0H13DRAFT_1854854 [Mycena leptocephala]
MLYFNQGHRAPPCFYGPHDGLASKEAYLQLCPESFANVTARLLRIDPTFPDDVSLRNGIKAAKQKAYLFPSLMISASVMQPQHQTTAQTENVDESERLRLAVGTNPRHSASPNPPERRISVTSQPPKQVRHSTKQSFGQNVQLRSKRDQFNFPKHRRISAATRVLLAHQTLVAYWISQVVYEEFALVVGMRRGVFSWKNPRMLRTVIAGCREKVMFEDLKPERSGFTSRNKYILCDPYNGCELSNLLQEHEYFNGRMARESLFSLDLPSRTKYIQCDPRKNMNILTGAWLASRYFPVIYPVAPNIFSVNRARNTKFTALEGTRNSLPLKEHGNSLPLKQHKITAVERT